MCSLAAAISPGYFGFTDWAFVAKAPSEIAVQVPIATRKNNALIIIFLSHSFILADAPNLFGLFSRLGPDQSHRNQRRSAACCRQSLTTAGRSMSRARMRCGRWGVKLPGEPTGPLPLHDSTESTRRVLARRKLAKRVHRLF